ncbi:MAG: trigger factor [Dehalococcoidales bacterium]|nr:trigger factor [Dehalococcoidales bacterium]
MKVTRDKTEDSQAFLTVEMEPVEVEGSLEQAYHRLVRKVNVPGFRKGKAPREILEHYIGRESLLEDALKNLIPQACEDAIKEQEIDAFARPSIEIAQTDPVVFKATVPLPPTIKLDDYHRIKVKPEPIKVTDDDVSAVIEQLRHQHAVWDPVERPVAFNDLVVFDIESKVEDKPFINQQGAQYQVIPDLSFPVQGFAEQLSGMQRDEEKEFKLQFPEDYSRKEIAGKEGWFKVKVTEIKQERLPELNDEFAKEVEPGFDTLDSLRERVTTNLKLRAEDKAKSDFEERVIEAVVKLAQVEFPPILVEMEVDHLINQQLRRWQTEGKGLEDYLASVNKTEAEIREELRPLAKERVTRSLVLGKVAEEEKIEVSDSEIDAEIENMTRNNTEKKDELNKLLNAPESRDSIRRVLLTRKTIERLSEIAKTRRSAGKRETKSRAKAPPPAPSQGEGNKGSEGDKKF